VAFLEPTQVRRAIFPIYDYGGQCDSLSQPVFRQAASDPELYGMVDRAREQ